MASLPWLIILWLAWAALLFGGFLFGQQQAGRAGRMPTWTRMTSSAILVIVGWSWLVAARGTPLQAYALLIAVGMTAGFVGDLAMARLLPLSPHVLWGMVAFGLGHVAYIAAALTLGALEGLLQPLPRYGAWIAWIAVAGAGWYVLVFRGQRPTFLHWAALPYALLLASTAGAATGLALQASALWPFAVGAALFLLSDLILAARLFAGLSFPRADDVVWLTYGPGQMLIVYGVGLALLRLG